eukprot:SAG11_NODE_15457_length_577_cov_1.615063_1_plen_39_part_01
MSIQKDELIFLFLLPLALGMPHRQARRLFGHLPGINLPT